ncbi:MAG TPA: SGNH/GDSL hydrolase family protein [Candidatus Dormibacteraeota bacterium]|jgi:lysophospholipase L1-like esterase|nr:SGNH/GDSL hydrolase family protein [Candidatus Dormibacteraeota bacterium]
MGRYSRALVGVVVTALLAFVIAGCARPDRASLTGTLAHRATSAHRSTGHHSGAGGATRTSTSGSAAAESQASPEQETPQPYRMLFVGASITAGIGATSTADSFPYLLGAEVRKMVGPVEETVVATPGAPVRVALRWPLPTDQDLVVVHMATNDFLRGTPLPLYQSDLLTLLRRIRAGSPHATLVCLGAWASPDQLNVDDQGPAAYNQADQADCQAEGGYYVPLQRFFGQRRLHDPMPVGTSPELRAVLGVYHLGGRTVAFHPSDAGNDAIAQAIYGVLERNDSLRPVDMGGSNV